MNNVSDILCKLACFSGRAVLLVQTCYEYRTTFKPKPVPQYPTTTSHHNPPPTPHQIFQLTTPQNTYPYNHLLKLFSKLFRTPIYYYLTPINNLQAIPPI